MNRRNSTVPLSKFFTSDQITEIQRAFSLFDRNGDGVISKNELEIVLRALGERPTPVEMVRIVRQIDRNRNGSIDFQEFLSFMGRKMSAQLSSPTDIIKAFKVFDPEGTGYLTRKELMRILTEVGEGMKQEDANKVMSEIEGDSHGRIDYKKLVHRLMSDGEQVKG
ncbi:calmodulin-A-like [Ornithodoros turicata]|uniref:calmodulin-A-like n=1 Tax=Ornithodoros turicata TaxID=34597 RepID=UPI00313863B4